MATYFGFPPVMSGEFYFVSYNSQDSARVGGIAREMNARGIPLWYDEGLLVGEAWEKQIARQIEQCRAVIMFVTKKLMARKNPYVKIEYNMAMGFKKKIYVIFLDNVTFDDVTIDLKGWWLRLNDLHGVPVSDISRAADIVDIMDRHIHFIRNTPVLNSESASFSVPASSPVRDTKSARKPSSVRNTKPVATQVKEETMEPVVVVDYEDTTERKKNSSSVNIQNNGRYMSKYEQYQQYLRESGQAPTNVQATRETALMNYGNKRNSTTLNTSSSSAESAGKRFLIVGFLASGFIVFLLIFMFVSEITFPFHYRIVNSDYIAVYGVKDSDATTLKIPKWFNGYSVEAIDDETFSECSSLKSITIPDSIESIGEDAFSGCPSDLTIYGKSGSYAETYAKKHSIKFVAQ